MPIIKSAKKALRQTARRTGVNRKTKKGLKFAVRSFETKFKKEDFKKVCSEIDKAAKKGIIHKNKASRLKSRLAKLLKENSRTFSGSSSLKKELPKKSKRSKKMEKSEK